MNRTIILANQQGQANSRFLIILYALGLVVLGAYPYQNQYKEIFNSARTFGSNLIARTDKNEIKLQVSNPPEFKAITKNSARKSTDESSSKNKPSKPLDKLEPKDRKELSKLIDSL